ncbi:MAG: hypothetical protein QOC59_1775 [Microbacteriaceae bacterium]|nr:hypothetical protein [Microbacteriaceae bacterium]
MERTASGHRTRLAIRRLHHTGPDPLRVLLVGDRALLGDPGRSPEAGLAERIADRLWLTTRRGVDLDLLTDLTPVLRAVHGAFADWRLWRYDAVVVVPGAPVDGLLKFRLRRRLEELVHEVLADAALTTYLLLVAPAPAHNRHAAPPVGIGRAAAAEDRFGTCSIERADGPAAWAEEVAGRLTAPLQRAAERSGLPESASARRNRPDPEPERQRALDELALVGREPDPRLTDIVELARTALGTECAEINFIDRDRQWRMAVAGSEREDSPRAESFCNLTIQRAEPTVIEDARLDPLLRLSPAVTGPRHIRFYAAYPLESPAGYRIGTLCVYDSEPRDATGLNLDLLRDLALLAQGELTGVDQPPSGVAVGPVSR